jgi:hypothetical protein
MRQHIYRRILADIFCSYVQTDNHTVDNTLLPTGDWQLAVDPDSIKIIDKTTTTTTLPQYIWAPDAAPVSMTGESLCFSIIYDWLYHT